MALYSALIHIMIEAAHKAARLLLRDFHEVDMLKESANLSKFINTAYSRSEKILIYETSQYPLKKGESWVFIPIDGKENFAHALPFFTIVISLLYKEEVVATVVEAPVFNETFWAESKRGAFMQSLSRTVKLKCSKKTNELMILDNFNCGFASKGRERKLGAKSLEFAYIAAGRADAVIYKKKEITNLDVISTRLLITESKGSIVENDNLLIGANESLSKLLGAQFIAPKTTLNN